MSVVGFLVAVFLGVRLFLFARRYTLGSQRFEVGFFHPYAASGGGGERVLWFAIEELLESRPDVDVVVYHGHAGSSARDVLDSAAKVFGIVFTDPERIKFVSLRGRDFLLEPRPRLTMLLQFVGGGLLAVQAVFKRPVDVFIDSTGHPASGPVVVALVGAAMGRLSFLRSIPVVTYTHYPTISKDMMKLVVERRPAYNNAVADSEALTIAKVLYYRSFALLYRISGMFVTLAMCNSNWTAAHVKEMFCSRTVVVYPPCGTTPAAGSAELSHIDRQDGPLRHVILSVGQFRVEKDHRLQLMSLPTRESLPKDAPRLKLVMVGGVRNVEDAKYVDELRTFAKSELDLDEGLDFEIVENATRDELNERLNDDSLLCGIHTMWNEHFGIGVVELMRHTIVVAHDSGGPKSDIVTPERDGFLASTAEEFRAYLVRIAVFQRGSDRVAMRSAALESCRRFDDAVFKRNFLEALSDVLPE